MFKFVITKYNLKKTDINCYIIEQQFAQNKSVIKHYSTIKKMQSVSQYVGRKIAVMFFFV